MSKKGNLILSIGCGFGLGTAAILVMDHIDSTEESKKMRIFKKTGMYVGALAVAALIGQTIQANEISTRFIDGVTTVLEERNVKKEEEA